MIPPRGKLGQNLTIENLEPCHYEETIYELQRAMTQLRWARQGKGSSECNVCGDNDHTAEQCWYHNPLLLALLGQYALLGLFWRCYHCGAVFTDLEAAERHFGETPAETAECLRQLAELAP